MVFRLALKGIYGFSNYDFLPDLRLLVLNHTNSLSHHLVKGLDTQCDCSLHPWATSFFSPDILISHWIQAAVGRRRASVGLRGGRHYKSVNPSECRYARTFTGRHFKSALKFKDVRSILHLQLNRVCVISPRLETNFKGINFQSRSRFTFLFFFFLDW